MKKLWLGVPHNIALPDAPQGWEKEKIPHTTVIYLGKTPRENIAVIKEKIESAKDRGMLPAGSITYDHFAFLGRDKEQFVAAAATEFDHATRLFDAAVQIFEGHFEKLSWDNYKAHMTIWKQKVQLGESIESRVPTLMLPVRFPLDRLVIFESLGGGEHEEVFSVELN